MDISVKETVFRVLYMFLYCLIILKLNISWAPKWFTHRVILKAVGSSLLLYFIASRLLSKFISGYLGSENSDISPKSINFTYLFITLMLFIISRAILQYYKSKADAIEKERLKRKQSQSELEALRNQVNPHFLFNSLNTLSLLIRQDQMKAENFVQKLSFLYRYILQSKEQDLVTLAEELHFLESYMFLIKERYGTKFSAVIEIDKSCKTKQIPSLALQLLVENAVKHNEISARHPLKVHIYIEDDFVVVKNKLQKRNTPSESTNIGLSNLQSRFKLLLKKDIVILNDETHFVVKLPLL